MEERHRPTAHRLAPLAAALLLTAACAHLSPGPGQPPGKAAVSPAAVAPEASGDQSRGIQVESLRLSALGKMLDFRYRVTDAALAKALLDRREAAYAVDEATGTKFPVPRAAKIGPLRQTAVEAKEGRTYFVLFANTGLVARKGSRVTVVIGNLRITGLAVE